MKKYLTTIVFIIFACFYLSSTVYAGAAQIMIGFEPDEKSIGKAGAMYVFSKDAARSGKRGIRITDKDKKNGSSWYSDKIITKEGSSWSLSFYARTISGSGCGVYIRAFTSAGKYIKIPEEMLIPVPGSKSWKQVKSTFTLPAGTAFIKVWIHSYNKAQCVVDIDDIQVEERSISSAPASASLVLLDEDTAQYGFTGLKKESKNVKKGRYAFRYFDAPKGGNVYCQKGPKDWNAYNVLSFWVHSEKNNNAEIVIVIESKKAPKVFSYYWKKFKIDFTGWKQFSIPFSSFAKTREPAGWQKIDRLSFRAQGWNIKPKADTTVIFDDIKLEKKTE